MSTFWTAENKAKLKAAKTDEQLAAAFPDLTLATLKRRKRDFKLPAPKNPVIFPNIYCGYDNCCYFKPATANARYCPEHKCKRKAENLAKKITAPEDESPEKLWALQEKSKVNKIETMQKKNQWLLDNSRFAYFDIETSNLNANIGMLFCACIKERGKDDVKVYTMEKDGDLLSDRKALEEIRDALEQFDYVCTYYGTGFDIPFLNTRLILNGLRPLDTLRHIDLYYRARFNLKLHSNRLAVVAEAVLGKSNKTAVMGPQWNHALMGNKAALDYIVEHCVIDVVELEEVFEQLRGFINLSAVRTRKYGGSY